MPALPLNMRLRKEVLTAIVSHLEGPDLNAAALGKRLGISRARATDLRERRTELFSLDALVTLARRAGLNVTISAARPSRQKPRGTSRNR